MPVLFGPLCAQETVLCSALSLGPTRRTPAHRCMNPRALAIQYEQLAFLHVVCLFSLLHWQMTSLKQNSGSGFHSAISVLDHPWGPPLHAVLSDVSKYSELMLQ